MSIGKHIIVYTLAMALSLTPLQNFAYAGQVFIPMEPAAQIRDVVYDVQRDRIYAAAYRDKEVWSLEPAPSSVLERIQVGLGPSDVALSEDGTTLASVNRLDNSVSLIDAVSFDVRETVQVGDGPVDIISLPGNAFAVANSFSDSVSIIRRSRSGAVVDTIPVTSVPVNLTLTQGQLAIATRFPPAIHYVNVQAETVTQTVSLPSSPEVIAEWMNNVLVLSNGELGVVSRAGFAPQPLEFSVKDFAVAGDRIYLLSENAVHTLDAQGNETARTSTPVSAQRIVAVADTVFLLAPRVGTWYAARETIEEQQETVAAAEESPIPEPAPDPPAEREELPLEAAPPEPAPVAVVEPETPEEEPPIRITHNMLPASIGVRAPQPGHRPPGERDAYEEERSVAQAFDQGLDLGASEEGFQAIDFTKPVRMRHWERSGSDFATGQIELEGAVHVTVGDTDLHADYLAFNQNTGEFEARGNVEIDQETANVTADAIRYLAPGDAEGVAPLRDELGVVGMTGDLQAENLHLREPNRSLDATSLSYNLQQRTGEFHGVRGHSGEIYFGAEALRVLGPASISGNDLWVTTCDRDPPHYRLRLKQAQIENQQLVMGKNARLQLGRADTPLYWPRYQSSAEDDERRFLGIDFNTGSDSELGFFVNLGQHYQVTRNSKAVVRFWPTENEGVGFGLELDYDFMNAPYSPLFRGKGEIETLYTTEEEGQLTFRHRQEASPNTVVLLQAEQWSDREFYKDFYYDRFRNRSAPRTFANATHYRPTSIFTATMKKRTHDFTVETERLPEVTAHVLERPLTDDLYFSFDNVSGHNSREPVGIQALRTVNIARLTYDWNISRLLYVTPFLEGEFTLYDDDAQDDADALRLAGIAGTTLQTRLHRAYKGRWGFRSFKHIIVPTMTVSHRPRATLDIEDTPFFDALDPVPGRTRIETKIDNIVFGHSAKRNEIWQVARVSLYQGNDVWNENRETEDYEVEIDVRPTPLWGFLTTFEHHDVESAQDIELPFAVQQYFLEIYERVTGQPLDEELAIGQFDFLSRDFNRLLSYFYYDEGDTLYGWNGRLGFGYTEIDDQVFNREIIYGLGWKIGEKWSVAFEHRFDVGDGELERQTYEIRRSLHKWETAIQLRDRESGFDISVEIYIAAFPGTRVRF